MTMGVALEPVNTSNRSPKALPWLPTQEIMMMLASTPHMTRVSLSRTSRSSISSGMVL